MKSYFCSSRLIAVAMLALVPFVKCFLPAITRRNRAEAATICTTAESPLFAAVDCDSSSISLASASVLSPTELWAIHHMELSYKKALAIKCPFFRRRCSDVLDSADMILRFVLARHKSLDLGPQLAWRCDGDTCLKQKNLSFDEIAMLIRKDWKESNNKGYYITGKLNTAIYRDDCMFLGPDPDMPVQGLRKYLNAASQLFDQGKSRSELLCFHVDYQTNTIHAKWRMNGILRLPWKPALPDWTGSTVYHRDEDGLIYRHEETWDMSVTQAFLRTLLPTLAQRIWDNRVLDADDEVCLVE
jgi:hypothetical protein